MDLSFAHPRMLWALLALLPLGLLEARALGRAARALRALVGPREPHVLLSQHLPWERRTGAWLRMGALALLVTGAAGPQWGRETVRRTSRGSDLVFAVDVSASMDVRDVAPSRIDEARREALGLLDRVEGSRVGVLAFAGDAVRLCPLTLDHAAARLTLETLNTGSVSSPGTDLGRALESALAMMPGGRRDDQAIVLWTDGEDLEGHAAAFVERLRGTGVRVFAVGVGTPTGDLVPVLDDQGRAVDVKRAEGGVVRSRLDEKLLRDLARATRGAYFSAARAGGELPRLVSAVGSLARGQRGSRLVERPVARFPWAATLAVILIGAELARPRRRAAAGAVARPLRRRAARRTGAAAALVVLAALPGTARAQSAWAKGDAAFRAGAWARAESLYALRTRHRAPADLQVDLATSRARQGKPATEWQPALGAAGDAPGRAGEAARYNLGTLLGEQKQYDAALEQLRRALERNPDDADARWNYELLARQRDQERQSKDKPRPDTKPQKPDTGGQKPRGNSGQQSQPPPPSPGSSGSSAQPPGQAPPPSSPGIGGGMSRQQAEQLLGSLQELERLERQRGRRARAREEKKEKDW
jgi:Ca-activated chloride channel family protein